MGRFAILYKYAVEIHMHYSNTFNTHAIASMNKRYHTGKCIRRFGGIYACSRYFIDRKW